MSGNEWPTRAELNAYKPDPTPADLANTVQRIDDLEACLAEWIKLTPHDKEPDLLRELAGIARALQAQAEGGLIPRDTDEKPSDAMPTAGHRDWREQAEWWQQTCEYWHERAEAAEADRAKIAEQGRIAAKRYSEEAERRMAAEADRDRLGRLNSCGYDTGTGQNCGTCRDCLLVNEHFIKEANEHLRADRDRLQAQLDEWEVPTESGGVELQAIGRVRLLRSNLVIEANRLRGEAQTLRDALERLKAAVRAWDADLSDACDGPLRDAVRAALATPDELARRADREGYDGIAHDLLAMQSRAVAAEADRDKLAEQGRIAAKRCGEEATRRMEAEAERDRLREDLAAMVYVHPCNCGDGIPQGQCARCRSVKTLGFYPDTARAALAGEDT